MKASIEWEFVVMLAVFVFVILLFVWLIWSGLWIVGAWAGVF